MPLQSQTLVPTANTRQARLRGDVPIRNCWEEILLCIGLFFGDVTWHWIIKGDLALHWCIREMLLCIGLSGVILLILVYWGRSFVVLVYWGRYCVVLLY